MRALVFPLPAGDAGIRTTVAAMVDLARRASIHPLVRVTAARLVTGEPRASHPAILRDFISDHTTFLPDPRYAELLQDPVVWSLTEMRDRGVVGLDCDDVAMLAAALGLTIGLRARYIVLAFGSAPNSPYQHVLTELSARAGVWVAVDPTRPAQSFAPTIARSMVVEV